MPDQPDKPDVQNPADEAAERLNRAKGLLAGWKPEITLGPSYDNCTQNLQLAMPEQLLADMLVLFEKCDEKDVAAAFKKGYLNVNNVPISTHGTSATDIEVFTVILSRIINGYHADSIISITHYETPAYLKEATQGMTTEQAKIFYVPLIKVLNKALAARVNAKGSDQNDSVIGDISESLLQGIDCSTDEYPQYPSTLSRHLADFVKYMEMPEEYPDDVKARIRSLKTRLDGLNYNPKIIIPSIRDRERKHYSSGYNTNAQLDIIEDQIAYLEKYAEGAARKKADDKTAEEAKKAKKEAEVAEKIGGLEKNITVLSTSILELTGSGPNSITEAREKAELAEAKLKTAEFILRTVVQDILAIPAPILRNDAYLNGVIKKLDDAVSAIREGVVIKPAEIEWPAVREVKISIQGEKRLESLTKAEFNYQRRKQELDEMQTQATQYNENSDKRLKGILGLLAKLTVDIDKLRGQFTKTALKEQVDEKVKRLLKTIML